MGCDESKPHLRPTAPSGWEAAMLEIEHQAEHWDTPDHGQTGHLIASALRSAVDIARTGGLRCEHRGDAHTPFGAAPDRDGAPDRHSAARRRKRKAA